MCHASGETKHQICAPGTNRPPTHGLGKCCNRCDSWLVPEEAQPPLLCPREQRYDLIDALEAVCVLRWDSDCAAPTNAKRCTPGSWDLLDATYRPDPEIRRFHRLPPPTSAFHAGRQVPAHENG